MTIEGSFYKIVPINDNSPLFDLYLLRTIKSKTNPREEFQLEGYGMPLESAISRVINYSINSKYADKAITIKEYLDVYKEIKASIISN